MGRACAICSHEDREEIDRRIVGGASIVSIADTFGMSRPSVTRHRDNHLSEAIRGVVMDERTDDLLEEIRRLKGRVERILDHAEERGQIAPALGAVRELRSLLELLGKVTGEIDNSTTVQVVNLQTSPEWLETRQTILGALEAHPDARVAVAEALAELEPAS